MEFYAKVKGNLSFEIKLPDESEAVNETFEFSLPCKLRLVGGKRRAAAEADAAEEEEWGDAHPKWDTRDAREFEVPANLKGHEGEVPANIREFKKRCDEEEERWRVRPMQKRAPVRPAVEALSEAVAKKKMELLMKDDEAVAKKKMKLLMKDDEAGEPALHPL